MTTLTLEVESIALGDIHPLQFCVGNYRDVMFALKGGGSVRLELIGSVQSLAILPRAFDDSAIDYGAATLKSDGPETDVYKARVAP